MPSERSRVSPAGLDKAQVIKVYRAIAPLYDAWAGLTEAAARRRCLEMADVRDGEAVLEVAVGTGITFAEIVKRNPTGRNEGIDLTDAMLNRARERLAKLPAKSYSLRVGDAYSLPFADEEFSLVLNSYMFDLLPEDDFPRVLAEFRRVLRPSGRLVLVNMAKGGRLGALWERAYRVSPSLVGGCRPVELSSYVEAAGFEQLSRDVVYQLGIASEILLARKPEPPRAKAA
jgi:ubiquinone/menaquinone biosynthesis C-methylase UbiE